MSRYLIFNELPLPESRVTRAWEVVSAKRGDSIGPLGQVKWYGAWRQYAFFPAPHTIFNPECLDDIAAFCREKTVTQQLDAKIRREGRAAE